MAALITGGDGTLESNNWSRANKKSEKAKSPGSRSRIPSLEEVSGKEEPKWTVFSGSQNLATALNDPAYREYDLFTKTWGGYFIPNASLPSCSIPNIELGDFKRYLKETAAGRKVHRSIARQLKNEAQEASSPVSPVFVSQQLQQDGRMYDMSSIPRIFMQADFSLEDPLTFLEVIPLSQLIPKGRRRPPKKEEGQGEGEGPQQSATLLHEKLTHYLDIIEVHLAYQISQRSDMFFSTLSSQQELQTHIMQVRHLVVELRHKLRAADRQIVHGGLKLVRVCTHRERRRQVYQKLKLIATVQQTQPTIQLLLSTSDFVAALDLITTTQDVLQQELQGVHSLRHLDSQLAELEKMIERMMEADFVRFTLEDIRNRLTHTRGIPSSPDEVDSEERLVSVVYGLLRQGKLHFLSALREELLNYLKNQVKELLRNDIQMPVVDGTSDDTPSLADHMRGMKFDAWLTVLEHVFEGLLLHLSTIRSSLRVIATVCEAASGGAIGSLQEGYPDAAHRTTTPDHLKKRTSFDSDFPLPPLNPVTPEEDGIRVPGAAKPQDGGLTTSTSSVMKSFEASAALQEAEDRLEQLFLEDELSDAIMGMTAGLDLEMDIGLLTAEPANQSSIPNSTVALDTSKPPNDRKNEGAPPRMKSERLSHRGSQVAMVSSSSVLAIPPELTSTMDAKEKERLKDSMAIAGVDDNAPITSSVCRRLLMECHEIMGAACELAHTRCAKILSIRARAGLLENLVSSEFVSLVRLIERFVGSSTQITGHHCPTLRSTLLSQARKFLEHFHEARRGKLSLLLDGERWKQADVPTEIQSLAQQLEAGIPIQPGTVRAPTPEMAQSCQPPSKYLTVHAQSFAVVGIVLLLLKIVTEYCQCADDLPMLVNEIMSKLIEILKHFNSRTCQLVLGAGAVEAVGLKTITARHLALVSRCLQAVILLIPDIKRHFQLRLAAKQHILLTQFDLVTEDFSSHCREINSKVMTIMDELIQKQLTKWEAKSPTPSPCFKTLIKQVIKLHENLVDILPPEQLQVLFTAIEQIFQSRLKMQLVKLGITNNGSTQHGIVNSELTHFKGALCSLESITAFGNTLFDVWTACPTGSRIANTSLCQQCNGDAQLRDYLFLGFISLVCIGVRVGIIGGANVRRHTSLPKLVLILLSLLENGLAMLFTLLTLEPLGSLRFTSCRVNQVSDFYPIFYNPTQDYVHRIDCVYEVVYPLYRMVFIFFAFSFLLHLLFLPITGVLIVKFKTSLRPLTEFAWLIIFPIIVVLYAIFAGLLYFAFDYLMIITSLGSFAIVSTASQLTKYGFKNPFKLYTSVEYWFFTVACMLYLAFGILSLTEAGSIDFRAQLLPLVLAPPILHPVLSYFASPKLYLSSWGLESYRNFYDN